MTIDFVLYVLAAICFGLSAFGVSTPRVSLLSLGLLFWVLTALI